MSDWKEAEGVSFSRTFGEADIQQYTTLRGDFDEEAAGPKDGCGNGLGKRIAHELLVAALISAVLDTRIPGSGAFYLDQRLHFERPAEQGDTVTVTATSSVYDPERGRMILVTTCRNQLGEALLVGEAEVNERA